MGGQGNEMRRELARYILADMDMMLGNPFTFHRHYGKWEKMNHNVLWETEHQRIWEKRNTTPVGTKRQAVFDYAHKVIVSIFNDLRREASAKEYAELQARCDLRRATNMVKGE